MSDSPVVLVTGATGFLAGHVVKQLLEVRRASGGLEAGCRAPESGREGETGWGQGCRSLLATARRNSVGLAGPPPRPAAAELRPPRANQRVFAALLPCLLACCVCLPYCLLYLLPCCPAAVACLALVSLTVALAGFSSGRVVFVSPVALFVLLDRLQKGYRVRGTVRSLSNDTKLRHLHEMQKQHPSKLELVQADLMDGGSWLPAVDGCTFVAHVASPAPAKNPKTEDELVKPAVEGTLQPQPVCGKLGPRCWLAPVAIRRQHPRLLPPGPSNESPLTR